MPAVLAASLPAVDAVDRSALRDSRGRTFKQLARELTPRYARVWVDIGVGYVVAVALMIALVHLERRWPRLVPLWVVMSAVALGYVIACLQLFLHEAAHFNIAPGRRLNDFLANLFLGLMVGTDVAAYRVIHFDHHRYLGTPNDPERSYFNSLDGRFLLRSLLGIGLLAALSHRGQRVRAAEDGGAGTTAPPGRARRWVLLLAGAALNLGIMVAGLAAGSIALAVAWPLAMICVHPFINATRQVLEHRSYEARRDVDYAQSSHGANTRMFGVGPLASTLGAAGFNRHLLHHWAPQTSYTRLSELEAFLFDTASADLFRSQVTTYPRAFVRLWHAR
jgi:fatty acid desaturase